MYSTGPELIGPDPCPLFNYEHTMRLTEPSSSRTQWHKHNKFPAPNGTRFHRTNQPETCHTWYDGLGGAVLGPLLAGGWHFTGLTGREVVGYAEIHTVKIGNGCVRLGHPVYAPTAQIARGGGGAPTWFKWPAELVAGMAAARAHFPPWAVPLAEFAVGKDGGQELPGKPRQVLRVRVYGPTRGGRRWEVVQ